MGLADTTLESLVASLGDRTPSPGGGAAASATAAISAALGRMVIAWSIGKDSLESFREGNEAARDRLLQWESDALRLADEDAEAYAALSSLMKQPADSPERTEHWDDAVDAAMAPPLATLELCCQVTSTLEQLVESTNTMLASDLGIAAVLAEAAARAAAWNIHANLSLVKDADKAGRIEADTSSRLGEITLRAAAIEQGCRS